MNIKETLIRLCGKSGVSGDELCASEEALRSLKEYTDDGSIDRFGNVTGSFGSFVEGRPTLLLDAHIDRIGLIVTFIDNEGFVKVCACGGVDRRVLMAQRVTIHGKKEVKGIVCVLPPHVKQDSEKTAKIEEMVIDTGYNAEELKKLISLGDTVTVDAEAVPLLQENVSMSALDDRSGVVSILRALELLKDRELKYNIEVSFCVQEETGERGAKMIGYRSNADMVLEMDVSFASTPDSKKEKCGKLGGGVMIGIAPSLDKEMSKELIKTAKEAGIPYQIEIMDGETGTNADRIGDSKCGMAACTLSIPLRYMHTPVEVINVSDIESTARLIAEFAAQ